MVEKEIIKNIIEQASKNTMRKSYSHKPHLAKLPYDLNNNNIDELQERVDACDKEIKNWNIVKDQNQKSVNDINKDITKLNKNKKELEKQLKETNETMKRHENYIYQQNLGMDIIDDFIDHLYNQNTMFTHAGDYWKGYGYGKEFKQITDLTQKLTDNISDLPDLYPKFFKTGKGLNNKLKTIISTSNKISELINTVYNKKDGDKVLRKSDTTNFNKIKHTMETIKDSVDIYSKTQKENTNVEKDLSNINNTLETYNNSVTDFEKNIDKATRMINDFTSEKERTQEKINKLK